ncbi:MAG: DUF4401 domain-containing protein [Gammaproteobacteria bacterium]|nr:DUF4401 domain-containing protein [Gammaproteobacteria bacterium]
MSQSSQPVWATLQQAGLVQGNAPIPAQPESPWFVKVLLAFSGWLASLFLLGFLGAGFEVIFRNTVASAITGSVMIGAAYFILRIPKNEFVEHIGLAVSLAGQALITWSLFQGLNNDKLAWIILALLQAGLAVVMPNFIHRVFSSFIAAFSFSMALTQFGAPYIFSSIVMFIAAWLWLHEFHFPKHIRKIHALGYGAVLGLIQLKSFDLFGIHHLGWSMGRMNTELWVRPWMAEVLAGVVMVYVVWQLLQRMGHRLSAPLASTALLGTVILSAVSVEAPGITVGMMILLLGFAGSNRVLMGLGIISLLFYISAYYYLLDATLLMKAETLLVTGMVLLLVRWLLLKIIHREKGATHG